MSEVDPQFLAQVTELVDTGRQALADGEATTALSAFRKLAEIAPRSSEAFYLLYSAAIAAQNAEAAESALNMAVTLHTIDLMPDLTVDPDRFSRDAKYNVELFQTCYSGHYVGLASVFGQQAIKLGVKTPDMLTRHALSLQHQGRSVEANNAFLNAFSAFPIAAIGQFYLFSLFHIPGGVQRYSNEARAWASRYAATAAPLRAPKPLDGRRLKVGYVAPSFTRSQIYQFILPVLEAHDPEVVDVTLYTADANAEMPLPCGRMVSIGKLSDDQAAELIRGDEQDILIDTWGHNAGSRIGIFARRAAPVQVAWINFVQTTGLPQMDYVLHSDSMNAPGTDALFTETIWRMGEITIPYRPRASRLGPTPTPALKTGQVTFSCFNNPAKVSAETVAAWARILKACPASVLLLKYNYFIDPTVQRAFQARFDAYGVEGDRLVFEPHSKADEYIQSFGRVDLALDPSPCPGGTTTCDALANGVPVLTLAGDNFYSRIGIQGVAVAALPDLVAENWDDYVAIAVRLATDLDQLGRVRARVQPGFDASAMRDEAGFARRLEKVFRDMTQKAIADGVAAA